MTKKSRKVIRVLVILLSIVVIMSFLTVVFLRARYKAEGTPQGVAYNYQLALIREDYTRAFGYLAPSLPNAPESVERFIGDLQHHNELVHQNIGSCIWVETVEETGSNAIVRMVEQAYSEPCTSIPLVTNLSVNAIVMTMAVFDGEWRIIHSDRHFVDCWAEESGCR